MDTLYTFWDNTTTHYKTESVNFLGLMNSATKDLRSCLAYWLQTQLFNFWASYKVVDSESFNFDFLGIWGSELVALIVSRYRFGILYSPLLFNPPALIIHNFGDC